MNSSISLADDPNVLDLSGYDVSGGYGVAIYSEYYGGGVWDYIMVFGIERTTMLDYGEIIGTQAADDIEGVRMGSTAGVTLYGLGGDDILYGGPGVNHLYGGDGNDQLWGGNAFNLLGGGQGDDTLTSGAGSDVLIGGD